MTRPGSRRGHSNALLLAAFLVLPPVAEAQYDAPPPPAAYALEDVTLVRADGSRLQGVDVVVRGGLVEILAAGASIPPDAEVLEGDSLFVYPGLVDADAQIEVDFPESEGRPGEDDVVSWDPPRSASGFMPHRRVAHHLTEAGEGVRGPRSKGIVAALVHPRGGMAPGQPAVLVLRPDARMPWELVDVESAGLTLSFQGARGVYPSQLFGVIAYLRQAFLDAERWAGLRSAYARDPLGMVAPSWDPDFEALTLAAQGEAPVYFRADGDEEIRRVLDLADQFGFRPVILGGGEAWKLADELQRRDVPVLVSVDFPDPRDWKEDADTAGAALEPAALREKKRIEAVRANAARLQEAGVRFALTSGGSGELLEGARTAVEYGLDRAAALRALTSSPAALLGIPSLARVERDMAATFLVADGDLFDEGTGVVYTFVEGHLEEGAATKGGGDVPADDLSGAWEGTMGGGGMELAVSVELRQSAEGILSGTIDSDMMGETPLSGSVSGRSVTMEIRPEGLPEPLRFTGTMAEDGQTVSGSGSSSFGEMTFRITKKPGGAREGVR